MRAAVIYNPRDIRIQEIPIPSPKADEVQIRIHACGVCGTDHSLFVGGFPANFPVIIGHEFSGEVTAVGEGVKTLKIGDRVTVDPNRVCHRCEYCRMGKEHLCQNLSSMGVHIDGADAEYCVMLESNVYKLPDYGQLRAGCLYRAACLRHSRTRNGQSTSRRYRAGPGRRRDGQPDHPALRMAGAAQVIVSEPIKRRRDVALENGATHVIDPFNQDVDTELRKIRQIGADVVFEVAGNLSVQSASVYYARRGGTVVWFGCAPVDGKIEVNPYYINDSELTIVGSFNNPFASATRGPAAGQR